MSASTPPYRSRLLDVLRRLLVETRLQGVDPDSDDFLVGQQEILGRKTMLRGVLEESYRLCLALDQRYLRGPGKRIEIGAGTGLFRSYDSAVLCTDIKIGQHLNGVVDAQNMPFDSESIRTIYGIHCFHHLPDPAGFLRELGRVLVPGGGCILIEPYYGFVAKWLFSRLFDTEHFDKDQKDWRGTLEMTAMGGANQALSYLVFVRDRELLEREFPYLEIVHTSPLNNYLRYLTSGGLYFKQLLPSLAIPVLRIVETLLWPLRSIFALHHVVVVRRRTTQTDTTEC